MRFEDKYFIRFRFSKAQIKKNLNNTLKDLDIAKKVKILDVKFNYAYTALIKSGITLLSYYQWKVKSAPGHHIKIIEKLAQILKADDIENIGNLMRSKRNLDFYAGEIDITKKECSEYISFVEDVINKLKEIILKEN